MKVFSDVEEAFKWWLSNIYPALPAERKNGKLRYAWRNYTYKKALSKDRMAEILKENGFKFQLKITYDP